MQNLFFECYQISSVECEVLFRAIENNSFVIDITLLKENLKSVCVKRNSELPPTLICKEKPLSRANSCDELQSICEFAI